jgi:hypothetical protein
MLRIPHCLDNRLADDRKVVSLKQRPRSTPQKHHLSASGTQSLVRLEGWNNLRRVKCCVSRGVGCAEDAVSEPGLT